MIFGSYSPTWFLGIDSALEGLHFLITILLAWYAYRIFRYGGGKQYKWWAAGFFLISLSYLATALTNLALYLELVDVRPEPLYTAIVELSRVYRSGAFFHTAFFLLGLLLLILVTCRVEDKILSALLVGLCLLVALGASELILISELGAALFISIILLSLRRQPAKTPTRHLVVIGFWGLLASQLLFLVLPVLPIAYVIGHLVEFSAYTLMLVSMIVILRT